MRILIDVLRTFNGVLVEFADDLAEVWGYIKIRTTFGMGHCAKVIPIKYLVVNAPSTYNVLFSRFSINRISHLIDNTLKSQVAHHKMKCSCYQC